MHILAEHRHWKKLAARFRRAQRTSASDPARMWRAAHEIGLLAENAYRAERGQSAVTAATSHLMEGATGVNVVEYQLSDGTVSCVLTVEHGRIQRIVPPFRKPAASEVARR